MKTLALFCLLAMGVAHSATAGVAGWITARTASWEFVEKTGGMRIGTPEQREGRLVLPVDYNVGGLRSVTRTPVLTNSALVVRRTRISRAHPGVLVLRVITSVGGSDGCSVDAPPADLSKIPPGTYRAFYLDAGDPDKQLGTVVVPAHS